VPPIGARPYDLATAAHDYPDWQGPPRRTVLICAHPRSGSTLLGEALFFAGGLGCPLEYFHRGFRPSFERRWGTSGIDALVRSVYRLRTDAGGVLGVKLFWQDLEEMAHELDPVRFPNAGRWPEDADPQSYRDLWSRVAPIFPNPAFVHLERRDRLRQAASSLAAIQSGKWRSIPAAGERGPDREPVYDPDRMAVQLALVDHARRHWRGFFAAIRETPYTVSYEDLDRDHAATVAGALAYLGSSAPVPPRRMQRQSDARTEAFVLQFLRDNQARAVAQR
jgi:LPS sulfotransferase NodH